MNIPCLRNLAVLAIAISLPVAGCAPTKMVKSEQYSGFLSNYSMLKEVKDADGQPVMRYINPRLDSGDYSKIIIDPVTFYPAPVPDENVDSQTLSEIKDYFDNALREKIGEKATVVDKAGPDVVRMRVALTAVASQTEGLKFYQYIPVALAVQGVKAAAGARPKQAYLNAELEMLDSESGALLGEAVKKGTGTTVEKEKEGEYKGKKMVALDNLKPVLDQWATQAANFVGQALGKR